MDESTYEPTRYAVGLVSASCVVFNTAKFICWKLMDENEVLGINGREQMYAHPVFQAVFGFGLEFIIITCIAWPLCTWINQSKQVSF